MKNFSGNTTRWLHCAMVALCCFSGAAVGNPTGGQVASGSANISQSGNVLTVTNTPNAIINWQGFSIAAGETINFIQQSASSAVLNRVMGPDPGLLLGAMSSNGKVFVINPAGVLFGKSAIVDTVAMVASGGTQADAAFLANISTDMQVNTGWNLLGNSTDAPIDVATAFGDVAFINTVWKWIAATNKWAFYTPAQADGGAAYAATKGYDFLTTINSGEGFWVNAKAPFAFALSGGKLLTAATQTPPAAGWNMVSIGEVNTPSQFNTALSQAQTVAGVSSLWAWDKTQSKWYFYAPSLEAQGGTALTDYITGKGYLDFTSASKTLGPGMGFWVHKL